MLVKLKEWYKLTNFFLVATACLGCLWLTFSSFSSFLASNLLPLTLIRRITHYFVTVAKITTAIKNETWYDVLFTKNSSSTLLLNIYVKISYCRSSNFTGNKIFIVDISNNLTTIYGRMICTPQVLVDTHTRKVQVICTYTSLYKKISKKKSS